MEIKNIFPTPILIHTINEELADKIENLVVPKLCNLDYNGEQYSDFFKEKIVKPEEISDLLNEIYSLANIFWTNTGYSKSTNINYWIQDYKPNDTHFLHNHGSDFLSGVYWIRANKDAGSLEFTSPNPSTYLGFDFLIEKSTPYTIKTYSITPEKGKLVLFPSTLFHNVSKGGSNCIRTSFAFNFSQ